MVRILISEGNSYSREALQQALRGEGYAVKAASGRVETAALVESFNPDVVLLDMCHSVARGIQPVGQIFLHHDVQRDTPVVFFAPAAYAAERRIQIPSLMACGDGGVFGALPESTRNKTLGHVRRICHSLFRCRQMMASSAIHRHERSIEGKSSAAENFPASGNDMKRLPEGRCWGAERNAMAA